MQVVEGQVRQDKEVPALEGSGSQEKSEQTGEAQSAQGLGCCVGPLTVEQGDTCQGKSRPGMSTWQWGMAKHTLAR